MISISERLRARQEPVGDGSGRWRKDGLCQEAADTIDALVAALDESRKDLLILSFDAHGDVYDTTVIDAALAKAKACHTGNSARGNAMKDEA